MAVWANDLVMDGALDVVATSDAETVCSAQPATYYEAVDPPAWLASTAYALGDPARPAVRNGFAYEVTTAGTSGASEPTWPTTAGATVVDGSVTWTCRNNYALTAGAALAGGDFTKANGDTSGRKVTTAQKANVSIHTSGTGDHVAKVDDAARRLVYAHTATAQGLTQGGTVTIGAHDVEIADPT